ncbi:hypothetical protein GL4_1473 [Methyloceanibacter caenitepidi]|uniref:Uncharacterized protein n=1 Tax=Methyloceanibacter caenitepidi TaxID=1384459 RepID=A0A0A8K4L3_9HYPH|nr:hypothetical protein GL4_1473 [Methyloceanibacter caenitepidi]
MRMSALLPQFLQVGVGQYEEATPLVARSSFIRREQARFNRKAQASKALADLGKSQIEMTVDVLAEDPLGLDFADDPFDVRPDVARILCSSLLAGDGERLAWVSGSEDIHLAAPRSAVKGSNVVPDRRTIQGFVFHPRHEGGRGEGFSLDKAMSSIPGFRNVEAELQASKSSTQCKAAERSSAPNACSGM